MISAQIIRIKILNEMTPEKIFKFHFDSSYGLINVYEGKRIPKSRYPIKIKVTNTVFLG